VTDGAGASSAAGAAVPAAGSFAAFFARADSFAGAVGAGAAWAAGVAVPAAGSFAAFFALPFSFAEAARFRAVAEGGVMLLSSAGAPDKASAATRGVGVCGGEGSSTFLADAGVKNLDNGDCAAMAD